jgi:lysozyme family protein
MVRGNKMTDFKIAFDKTMKYEGGYVNDPVDPGGETYRGITRRSFPKWEGWKIIDEVKNQYPRNLKETINNLHSDELDELVYSFYKEMFWDKFRGDEIPFQKIANILFDSTVNMGPSRPIKFLQKALNIILPVVKLKEDGLYGFGTHAALLLCLAEEVNQKKLVIEINNMRREFYYKIVKNNPSQSRFLQGWLKRIEA